MGFKLGSLVYETAPSKSRKFKAIDALLSAL